MSLIQFLSVGRSLGTVRDAPSRFRMTQENLLPKFGPAKPCEAEASSEPVQQTHAPVMEQEILTPMLEVEAKKALLGARTIESSSTAMKPEILEQSQKPVEPTSGFLRRFFSPWKGWALLGAPLKGMGRIFRSSSPFQAKPARSARHRGPVQPELGLDLVKPVRNDLSDTDLELIPARKALAENKPSATLIGQGVSTVKVKAGLAGGVRKDCSTPKIVRSLRPSAQHNVFSPPQPGPAEPSSPPELVFAGKSDVVGAWWGRLRTGLSKFRSRQT